MSEALGAHRGDKIISWEVALSGSMLVIASYELLGVIYVQICHRPPKMECTKLLQGLVTLCLVIYLTISFWVIVTVFRSDEKCKLLSNLVWFIYLVLATVIYMYYYTKQRVLSTAMGKRITLWWVKPLLVLCICLIITTLVIGV